MHVWAVAGLVALLADPSARIERVQHWADAVGAHRPGTSDASLQRIAAMSIAEVQLLGIDAQTLITLMRRPGAMVFFTNGFGKGQVQIDYSVADIAALRTIASRLSSRDVWCTPPSAKCANDFLKRAALLEADVAMLGTSERAPISGRAGASFSFEVKVNDGQTLSVSQAPVHWALGRRMLDLITPTPSQEPMVRAWYAATIAQLEANEQHDSDHHQRALALFPGNATILFFNGCLHEGYASARTQAAIKGMRLPTGMNLAVGSTHSELQIAEEFLRKAVAADPGNGEARLHFGRVLGLLGHHEDASTELRRATDHLGDPANEFYAAMFLGRELEALGRFDTAQASYARAAALYPNAQSAQLALSQLAWRTADPGGAVRAAHEALKESGEDPWWSYDVAHARQVDALLDQLRRPFLEDRHQ